ncbi:hypothetical protein [Henriciella sp.]|uniref:hypothetical protein n=1 Tax=Henriciella sp. TaxID=1968823 RepID=UPI002636B7A3|nr:hypothetical protein [Henriciella sp.]
MSDTTTEDTTETTETLMTSAADNTESTVSSKEDDAKADEPDAKASEPPKADEDPEAAKADDGEKKADADTPDPATFEFTTPDDVQMADETLEGVKSLAAELGLDNEQAQKIVDLGSQLSQRWASEIQSQHEAQVSEWGEQAKADKEIGGDKFEQSLADAKAAYDKFATPELTGFLNESGLGNHPEVIRLFARLNKQVGDDTLVAGQPAPSGPKTQAERLYGTN